MSRIIQKLLLVGIFSAFVANGPASAQQYPSGSSVAAEAMARALAEKARNDEIVRQQRARENERRMQEQRVRDLENAQRRARTG
jgi:hypothetical protein